MYFKIYCAPLFKRTLCLCFLISILSSCAAKQVDPVSMVQPGDAHLTCAEIKRQIAANGVAVGKLLREDMAVENQNTAKSIGSVVPVAGIFIGASTDLSNEEQIKARALLDRNEHLNFLIAKNGCK